MGCPVIVSYLLTKYGASPQDISELYLEPHNNQK